MKEIRLLEQNFVLLSGYLARDPDVRFTQKGSAMCSFTLGVTRRFKDTASGEWKDEVSWIPVVVWGEAAERLKDKLKKGSPVHVEGRLRSEEYEDKTGQKRSALKVVARRVQFLAKVTGSESPASPPSSAHEEPVDSKTDLEEVPF
ncbi:MAG: single-stranded DNA-binding protein [Elusimicrobiota bacterium]